MSQLREPSFDRTVALVLRIGAFSGFVIMLAGLIAGFVTRGPLPLILDRTGVIVMLVTPAVRVAVAMFLFLREKDWKFGAISFGVLLILVLGSLFGIGEH
jgi:uncharacterized membrane protein